MLLTKPKGKPGISNITLTDTLFTIMDGCQVNIQLEYYMNNIGYGSDSEVVYVFLHNGRIISTNSGKKDKNVMKYFILTPFVAEVTWALYSDTTGNSLLASDSLSTIDSSIVDISYWYDESRQSVREKF